MGLVRGFHCGAALFEQLLGIVLLTVGIVTSHWVVLTDKVYVGLFLTEDNGQLVDTANYISDSGGSGHIVLATIILLFLSLVSFSLTFGLTIILQKRTDRPFVISLLLLSFLTVLFATTAIVVFGRHLRAVLGLSSDDYYDIYNNNNDDSSIGYSLILAIVGSLLSWLALVSLGIAMKEGEFNKAVKVQQIQYDKLIFTIDSMMVKEADCQGNLQHKECRRKQLQDE